MKAKALVDKAKQVTSNKTTVAPAVVKPVKASTKAATKVPPSGFSDRRAIWHTEEDELLLLTKVASLYLMPGERCVPFKLISDIIFEMIPPKLSSDKSVSSIGRRVKVLMKLKVNRLFVLNKYELCKQDRWLDAKYGKSRSMLKRNVIDKECVALYVRFITDVIERIMKRKKNDSVNGEAAGAAAVDLDDEGDAEFEMPETMEEFKRKYTVVNTNRDILFKTQSSYFQQPTTDYEITCHTVHSAIHVINSFYYKN
jgi:hypothetical protein